MGCRWLTIIVGIIVLHDPVQITVIQPPLHKIAHSHCKTVYVNALRDHVQQAMTGHSHQPDIPACLNGMLRNKKRSNNPQASLQEHCMQMV